MPLGVYKKYVESENDIIAQIKYCVYKNAKLNFIEQYKIEKGKDPSVEELQNFQRISLINQASYECTAEKIVINFLTHRENSYLQEKLKTDVKNYLKPSIGERLLTSMLAPIIASGLTLILYFMFALNAPQPIKDILYNQQQRIENIDKTQNSTRLD